MMMSTFAHSLLQLVILSQLLFTQSQAERIIPDRHTLPNGLQDVNGSHRQGGCTRPLVMLCTGESDLVNGETPQVDCFEDEWANGFFTVRIANGMNHVEIGFDFRMSVIVSMVEVKVLNSPSRGIEIPAEITVYGSTDMLFPFFDSGLRSSHKLSNVSLTTSLNDSLQNISIALQSIDAYRYYFIRLNVSTEWLFLAEITFFRNQSTSINFSVDVSPIMCTSTPTQTSTEAHTDASSSPIMYTDPPTLSAPSVSLASTSTASLNISPTPSTKAQTGINSTQIVHTDSPTLMVPATPSILSTDAHTGTSATQVIHIDSLTPTPLTESQINSSPANQGSPTATNTKTRQMPTTVTATPSILSPDAHTSTSATQVILMTSSTLSTESQIKSSPAKQRSPTATNAETILMPITESDHNLSQLNSSIQMSPTTTLSEPTVDPGERDQGSNTITIIIVCAACITVITVAIIIILFVIQFRRKQKSKTRSEHRNVELTNFKEKKRNDENIDNSHYKRILLLSPNTISESQTEEYEDVVAASTYATVRKEPPPLIPEKSAALVEYLATQPQQETSLSEAKSQQESPSLITQETPPPNKPPRVSTQSKPPVPETMLSSIRNQTQIVTESVNVIDDLYATPTTTTNPDIVAPTDVVYSEPIKPSLFTDQGSSRGDLDPVELPYASIYTVPVVQPKDEEPLLEVTSSNIREVEKLGMGQFGQVILAETVGLSRKDMRMSDSDNDKSKSVLVAVKKLRPNAPRGQKEAFEKEYRCMARLRDPNVIRLLGICTTDTPFIMMEYMEKGDLNQYLQKFASVVSESGIMGEDQITKSTLLYMSTQIASAMKYLESHNFIHRDLATRNCLVGHNYLVKIADFGMSRNLYESHYYRLHGKAILPIRWMANECFYGKFSQKTDAWAFGVTMWEIYSLAKQQPYSEMGDQEVIHDATKREKRQLLERPEACPPKVYEIMLKCWAHDPRMRATFEELHTMLVSLKHICD